MAFPVNFYSFTKEVNSTAQPAGTGTVYQCVSNADFDIIAPRLPLNLGAAANPSGLNYCRVPAWSRYYWVRRWAFEGGLWVAYCQVDPLASWKTQIGQTSAYVLRSAYANDGSIPDHMYPTKSAPTVSDVTISKDWSDSDLDYSDGRFIVGTIGSNGATTYAALTPAEFVQFATAAFSDNFFNQAATGQNWMTKAIFDPMQYLSSVTWFPFDLTGASGRAQDVYLGYWFTGVRGLALQTTREYTHTVTLPKHPQRGSRGSFLDSAPYSNYILDLRPFGRIELKSDLLAGSSSITISYIVDWISGQAILRVTNATGTPIAVQQSQLGVTVQISQVLRDYLGGALGMVGAGVQTGLALVTGNIPGAIAGAASAIGNAVNTAQPDVTTSGLNSGFSSLQGSWHLIGTFYQLADEDNAHRGRPLCQVRQLSTLPGYQLCTDTDLQIPCTKDEMDVIRGYLESGYYYE